MMAIRFCGRVEQLRGELQALVAGPVMDIVEEPAEAITIQPTQENPPVQLVHSKNADHWEPQRKNVWKIVQEWFEEPRKDQAGLRFVSCEALLLSSLRRWIHDYQGTRIAKANNDRIVIDLCPQSGFPAMLNSQVGNSWEFLILERKGLTKMKITINLEGWERGSIDPDGAGNLRGPNEQAHWMLRQELGMRGHAMQIDGKEQILKR